MFELVISIIGILFIIGGVICKYFLQNRYLSFNIKHIIPLVISFIGLGLSMWLLIDNINYDTGFNLLLSGAILTHMGFIFA